MKEELLALHSDLVKDLDYFTNPVHLSLGLRGEVLSTFSLGGSVPILLETNSFQALSELLRYINYKDLTPRILGNGSNIVFPNEGIDSDPIIRFLAPELKMYRISKGDVGLLNFQSFIGKEAILHFNDFNSFIKDQGFKDRIATQGDEFYFRLHAGTSLMGASRVFTSAGLGGLEFAAGIPGTIGGAIRMNAGAHGEDISQIISSVFALSPNGSLHVFSRKDLSFSYRHCSIPSDYLIIAADITLISTSIDEAKDKRAKALSYRKKTQPLQFPSAGSVFRNPSPGDNSAGQLIESCGLKGLKRGGMMISDLHANWIVKCSSEGSSSDVRSLVDLVIKEVAEKTGINLIPEIVFWNS